MMKPLLNTLSDRMAAAFSTLDLPPELAVVRVSDRPDLAQFQCNGAMAAAKKIGQNPREIAGKIVNYLGCDPLFQKVEAVGPGFINMTLTDSALTAALIEQMTDPHFGITQTGAGKTALLDYGGPNAAKAMHVGHLRSAVIGDTLRRLLKSAGYNAIGDIHLGDDGLQAGMVISELEIRYPDWPYFDPTKTNEFPSDFALNFDDLSEVYPAASADAKADPVRMERARRATFDLQQGRPGFVALWRNIIEMSKKSMCQNYGTLNVHFDLWKSENGVSPLIPDMVKKLQAQHFAIESQDALVIPVARNDDKKEMPPLILIKSDGAYLYATTDLATLIDRMTTTDHPRPAWCIYVVDQRQSLHFEQVFRAARMTGIVPENIRLDFAGFGTMNGTDGKPFKTRAGGILRLQDLLAEAINKAQARMTEAGVGTDWTDEERNAVARAVAVAAIKFADLKNVRHMDYVFDLDAMTSFEGKTGPYLLYQAVRIKSILARAKAAGFDTQGSICIDDSTRALALLLADFPGIIAGSIENLSAHILVDYLHRVAQDFSAFYAVCHIMTEKDETRRAAWLGLCIAILNILTKGLDLMGMDVPERM